MKAAELKAFENGQAVINFDKIDEKKIKAIELLYRKLFIKKPTISADNFGEGYYQYYFFKNDALPNYNFLGVDKLPFAVWILNLSEIFNEIPCHTEPNNCQPELSLSRDGRGVEGHVIPNAKILIGSTYTQVENYPVFVSGDTKNQILSENDPIHGLGEGFFRTHIKQEAWERPEIAQFMPDFEHDQVVVGYSWLDTAFTATIPMEAISKLYSKYLSYRKKAKNE